MPALNDERTNPITGRAEVWTGSFWSVKPAAALDLSSYAKKTDIPAAPDLTDYAKKADIPASPDLAPYAKLINLAERVPRTKVWGAALADLAITGGQLNDNTASNLIPLEPDLDAPVFAAIVSPGPANVTYTITGLTIGQRYEFIIKEGIALASAITIPGAFERTNTPDWRVFKQYFTATKTTYDGSFSLSGSANIHGPAVYSVPRLVVHDKNLAKHDVATPDDLAALGAKIPTAIKGDTGAAGPKGDTGATGPKGDKGDPGTTVDVSSLAPKSDVPVVRFEITPSEFKPPQTLPFTLVGGTAQEPSFAMAGSQLIDSVVYNATGAGVLAYDINFATVAGKQYDIFFAVRSAQAQQVVFRDDGNINKFSFNGPNYTETYPGFEVIADGDFTVIRQRFTATDTAFDSRLSFQPGVVQGPVIRAVTGSVKAFAKSNPAGIERRLAVFDDIQQSAPPASSGDNTIKPFAVGETVRKGEVRRFQIETTAFAYMEAIQAADTRVTATLDATEIAFWRLMSQSMIPAYSNNRLYPAGFLVRRDRTYLQRSTNGVTGAAWDATEAGFWAKYPMLSTVNWASNNNVIASEERFLTIGGIQCRMRSYSTRFTGAAIDAAELVNWQYVSQIGTPDWAAGLTLPEFFRVKQGPRILEHTISATTRSTFDATEEGMWRVVGLTASDISGATVSVQNSAWFDLPTDTSYERPMPGAVYTSLYFEFSHPADGSDIGSFSLSDFTTSFNASGFYGTSTRFINTTMPVSGRAVTLVISRDRPNTGVLINVTTGGASRGRVRNVILNGVPADTQSATLQAAENNDAERLAALNARIDAAYAQFALKSQLPTPFKTTRYKVFNNTGSDQSVAANGAVEFTNAAMFENGNGYSSANLVSGNRIVCPDAGFVSVTVSAFVNSSNSRLNLVHYDSSGTVKQTYTLAIVAPTASARQQASYLRVPVAAGDRFGMINSSGAAINVFRAEHHTEISVVYVP